MTEILSYIFFYLYRLLSFNDKGMYGFGPIMMATAEPLVVGVYVL